MRILEWGVGGEGVKLALRTTAFLEKKDFFLLFFENPASI
jgi:hypothetical protein